MRIFSALCGVFIACAVVAAGADRHCALDRLLEVPAVWDLTPACLVREYGGSEGGGYFRWLNQEQTRAAFSRNCHSKVRTDLTLFEGRVPLEEAVVDFAGGRVNVISISIYNRGDCGRITGGEFAERFREAGDGVGQVLGVRAVELKADKRDGLVSEGLRWVSEAGLAVLDHDEGAMMKRSPEFLRLRLARKDATGGLAAALQGSRGGATVRLSELAANVRTDEEGNTLITGLPMVDQGDKGYCVVASVQRLLEYYGIGVDMHQLAAVAGSDPEKGTSTLQMARELKKIDYRFKTRLDVLGMLSGGPEGLVEVKRDFLVGEPIDERRFIRTIRSRIDAGLPLLWSLELGRYPEEPNLNPQTSGGHMRMIIGYNERSGRMIFSDSWGADHERKTMAMTDAYRATTGLFALQPTVR
jgi:hypothetical protein